MTSIRSIIGQKNKWLLLPVQVLVTILFLLLASDAFLIRGAATVKAFPSSIRASQLSTHRNNRMTSMATTTRRQTRLSAKKPAEVPSNNKLLQSQKATTTANNNNNNNNKALTQESSSDVSPQLLLLLQDWRNHSDASFHHFSESDATEIRRSLLSWYRVNRRKLPWRGDPPPYDGSTAGINNQAKKKAVKVKEEEEEDDDAKQPNITSFFKTRPKRKVNKVAEAVVTTTTTTTTTSSSISTEATTAPTGPKKNIPVSGYGVWVSEIMLQQTRVEAVIPYWIKCKIVFSNFQSVLSQCIILHENCHTFTKKYHALTRFLKKHCFSGMESFPTVHDLANATEDQVNAHWAGLGFYRRARMLHQGAKHVVHTYDGSLPQTKSELLTIAGIGPYTASAIASIAFDVCVPVVDGNVCRVLSRLTGIANHIKAPVLKDKQLGWDLATQLVEAAASSTTSTGNDDNANGRQEEKQHAGEVNQALMELGATYCAPSGTGTDDRDPLKEFYLSTRLARAYRTHLTEKGEDGPAIVDDWKVNNECACELCVSNGIEVVLKKFQESITQDMTLDEAAAVGHATFPLDPPKSKKREEDIAVAVIVNTDPTDGDVWWLLVKRPSNGLLAGQWEFPSVCVATRTNDNKSNNKPPPGVQKRRKATDAYLRELFEEDVDNMIPAAKVRTGVDPAPLEHIFSHVKHYMWVETCETSTELKLLEWGTRRKKEVRWMREKDMKEVGITSGVKKILKAVKTQIGAAVAPAKKRKR
jgi:A/G-specific adenine glycosylase